MHPALTFQAKPATPVRPGAVPATRGLLQHKCACGDTGGPCVECEERRKKRQSTLQSCSTGPERDEAPPFVREALRSPGQPLAAETRAFMGPRYGQGFCRGGFQADAETLLAVAENGGPIDP
ncbi:MAG: hypothetical protein HYY24_08655 [Verrucomicrobia bacterium]|nr:hypothetical protein [Verrucomicrobiota bacterium]